MNRLEWENLSWFCYNGAGKSGGNVAAVDVMMFRCDVIVIDQPRC